MLELLRNFNGSSWDCQPVLRDVYRTRPTASLSESAYLKTRMPRICSVCCTPEFPDVWSMGQLHLKSDDDQLLRGTVLQVEQNGRRHQRHVTLGESLPIEAGERVYS